jgi:hypothetical protein
MNIHRRIKVIMSKQHGEHETELLKLAHDLGCSLSGVYGGDGSKLLEDEVIRRILEMARNIRDSHLWWIALISAAASTLSALAAWCAVLSKR